MYTGRGSSLLRAAHAARYGVRNLFCWYGTKEPERNIRHLCRCDISGLWRCTINVPHRDMNVHRTSHHYAPHTPPSYAARGSIATSHALSFSGLCCTIITHVTQRCLTCLAAIAVYWIITPVASAVGVTLRCLVRHTARHADAHSVDSYWRYGRYRHYRVLFALVSRIMKPERSTLFDFRMFLRGKQRACYVSTRLWRVVV